MGPAGPAEVPGAGSVAIGRTQLDRLLRVIPKPASVSMNQLRLAASIAGQDQVRLGALGVVCGCSSCYSSGAQHCRCYSMCDTQCNPLSCLTHKLISAAAAAAALLLILLVAAVALVLTACVPGGAGPGRLPG